MSTAQKIPSLHDELLHFMERYGKERAKVLADTLKRGTSRISWPIVANFLSRKGYVALSKDDGLLFLVTNCL